jgi:hypothetical protein
MRKTWTFSGEDITVPDSVRLADGSAPAILLDDDFITWQYGPDEGDKATVDGLTVNRMRKVVNPQMAMRYLAAYFYLKRTRSTGTRMTTKNVETFRPTGQEKKIQVPLLGVKLAFSILRGGGLYAYLYTYVAGTSMLVDLVEAQRVDPLYITPGLFFARLDGNLNP